MDLFCPKSENCSGPGASTLPVSDHLGFIKLGSRVDVYLPIDSEVCVKMGQATTGDQTIIAKLK